MLMITPDTLYGHIGAILSALIVISCFIGLTLDGDVFAGIRREGFFWYYTNLSNLLVLFYFTGLSPFLYQNPALYPLIPYADFFICASIMLTNAVFHFLILPGILPQFLSIIRCKAAQMLAVNNLLVHYVVPLLVLVYYLLCSPDKDRLPPLAAPLWLVFPLLYAGAVFLRARTKRDIFGADKLYPYPFLDVCLLGKRQVVLNCVYLLAVCVLFSLASVWIIRECYAFFGGGKSLFLVG